MIERNEMKSKLISLHPFTTCDDEHEDCVSVNDALLSIFLLSLQLRTCAVVVVSSSLHLSHVATGLISLISLISQPRYFRLSNEKTVSVVYESLNSVKRNLQR
ncbi:CLUMA_CG016855, isoform A [Clunio marinus]|uniref:CLUMA_CG016855, isoform A n=1 Tax=Clunio marinus TaxID=568069 RepID=A0A1J1IVE5_9DIPT|nr:CLUMA_CG016855, isoform A [Clunio marinus]